MRACVWCRRRQRFQCRASQVLAARAGARTMRSYMRRTSFRDSGTTASSCPSVGSVSSGGGVVGVYASAPHVGEEGQGEHAHGGLPVPGAPFAHFVLVEADLVLRRLESLLDHPPLAGGGHQLGQGGAGGGVAQEVGDLADEFALLVFLFGTVERRISRVRFSPAGVSARATTAKS